MKEISRDRVIAGDFLGKKYLDISFRKGIFSFANIDRYEVKNIKEINENSVSKSVVGALLFGTGGAVAGINAKQRKIYTVAVYFKTGEKSLFELCDVYYDDPVKNTF